MVLASWLFSPSSPLHVLSRLLYWAACRSLFLKSSPAHVGASSLPLSLPPHRDSCFLALQEGAGAHLAADWLSTAARGRKSPAPLELMDHLSGGEPAVFRTGHSLPCCWGGRRFTLFQSSSCSGQSLQTLDIFVLFAKRAPLLSNSTSTHTHTHTSTHAILLPPILLVLNKYTFSSSLKKIKTEQLRKVKLHSDQPYHNDHWQV